MEIYNYIALVVMCAAILAAILIRKKRPFSERFYQIIESRKFEIIFVGAVVALSAVLRIVLLGDLPAGMNQDEASIGYDAWSLANYGVDRNGYAFPVYPVAWGAGHGPFYMYLSMIFIKFFGNSLFVYRLPQALLGVLSVLVFYLIIKKSSDRFTGYIGALLLCVCPWHIMSSRWGLDANPAPFLILFGLYFFVKGCADKKTWAYIVAAVLLAMSLYTYASTYVTVPILLLILVIVALVRKYISVKQLLFSAIAFVIAALPLGAFWIVNFFDLPEVRTAIFSIPRLTALRSGSVFLPFDEHFFNNVLTNVGNLFSLLFSYPETEIYNIIQGYNIIYVFTFPLFLLGAAVSFKNGFKKKAENYDFVMCAWFIASVAFSLMVKQNINRINVLFIPVVYFVAVGVIFLSKNFKELFVVAFCLILAASVMFVKDYFGKDYRQQIGVDFMKGFGEAAVYADSLKSDTLYCADAYYDGRIKGGYLLLAYYCKVDPNVFNSTVNYYVNDTQFRYATNFSKYVFMIPDDPTSEQYQNDVFVLPKDKSAMFDDRYTITYFDNYIVVNRK